eukprot:3041963-Rhodomonas_salina.2
MGSRWGGSYRPVGMHHQVRRMSVPIKSMHASSEGAGYVCALCEEVAGPGRTRHPLSTAHLYLKRYCYCEDTLLP